MKYFSTHILFIARPLVVVTFLASSGLATVLHNCTMVAATCCEAPAEINHKNCDKRLPANSDLFIQSNAVCHANTVVGGVTTNPAVLDKDGKSELKNPLSFVFAFTSSVEASFQINTSFNRGITAPPVFLPSVEKYVLNASFLI